MRLFNSLGRQLEEFTPVQPGKVKLYTCGPTVYDYQHIGNYSGYIYWDVLVRALKSQGYDVKRVMNITDVGHLMSDADEGEDKLEKGAKREGKSAREIADYYAADFFRNMKALNLIEPDIYAKATDFVDQQLEMIKILVDKGFAYQTKQAVYFDVTKLDNYGQLTGQKLEEKEVAARPEVVADPGKHHPQDFGLWFFTVGRFAGHQMHWSSPWGEGFPGWHIECSAIIHATLGEPIDIHTGGIDHIGTHHPNEMAQTEAAFGKPLAKFWIHNNHMMVDGRKMSKSAGNFIRLKDLADRGYSPMDFKMLVLSSHYRSQSNFTWESLEAARKSLSAVNAWADQVFQPEVKELSSEDEDKLKEVISSGLADDLATHSVITSIFGAASEGAPSKELLAQIDAVTGFQLSSRADITKDQMKIIADREKARQSNDYIKADELRSKLAGQGIELNDTPNGPVWSRL